MEWVHYLCVLSANYSLNFLFRDDYLVSGLMSWVFFLYLSFNSLVVMLITFRTEGEIRFAQNAYTHAGI